MKRIMTLLLVIAMVLGLCACGASGGGEAAGKKDGLQVGYNRQNITPGVSGIQTSVPMAGYGNDLDRISNGFIDYIFTTCIAFQEGDQTVLLFTNDLMGMGASAAQRFVKGVADATGVPVENIVMCDTHTHYSPSIISSTPASANYMEQFGQAAIAAAKAALEDLAPATLYSTKTETENMNFIRHYEQNDGSITSSNLGNLVADDLKGHARESDPEMILFKIEREGEDKKDILMMNWGCHPCQRGDGKSTNISADYIGTARTYFEKETDMNFAFFQAAAGDVGADSKVTPQSRTCEQFGQELATYAINALPNMQKIEGQGIKTYRYTLNYDCNHFQEDMLDEAKQVMEMYEKSPQAADALAVELGFFTYTHARGVYNASKNPANDDMELNAIYIGGMAFVTTPWEMFAATGKYLKDNSPFENTMVLALANGKTNYVPIAEAYDYGCYESFSAHYGKGAAEAAADQLLTMLKSFQ